MADYNVGTELEDELYEHHRFEASKGQSALRVDKFLMNMIENTTRNKIQQAAENGSILVNDVAVKSNYKVKAGDVVRLVLAHPTYEQLLTPENIPLDIVYEDDQLLVINKPAGMVVHPGHGNYSGTLVNALAYHFENLPMNSSERPGLVHRIDKDTSGLLVVAKNLEAQFSLSKQLAKKTVYRVYDLIVYGNVIAGGTVDEPIKRHPVDRVKMAVLPGGKDAVTHYNVKERFQHFTRIQARLETGRTHQIRVHFSYIGFGLVGDPVYMPRVRVPAGATELLDETLRGFRRQALHAAELGLKHPRTGEEMLFKAPWPADLATLVDVLRTENKAY
jgi:23S rRNA pseudouridine1911/1915/1917 synthase